MGFVAEFETEERPFDAVPYFLETGPGGPPSFDPGSFSEDLARSSGVTFEPSEILGLWFSWSILRSAPGVEVCASIFRSILDC